MIKPLKSGVRAHCTGRVFVELETKIFRMYINSTGLVSEIPLLRSGNDDDTVGNTACRRRETLVQQRGCQGLYNPSRPLTYTSYTAALLPSPSPSLCMSSESVTRLKQRRLLPWQQQLD